MMRHFVTFGASGDLTARYLLPPLAQLLHAGKLPVEMTVLGAASESWDKAHFQGHIRARLKKLLRYGSTGVAAGSMFCGGSWSKPPAPKPRISSVIAAAAKSLGRGARRRRQNGCDNI